MKKDRKPRKKADNHFVDNEKLYQAFCRYHKKKVEAEERGEERPPFCDEIGEAIYLIATNLVRKPNFSRTGLASELIGEGIISCVKYGHNFNPEKYDNPFSYLTKICYRGFLQRIQKEKRQKEIKVKYVQEVLYPSALSQDSSSIKWLMKHYDTIALDNQKFEDEEEK